MTTKISYDLILKRPIQWLGINQWNLRTETFLAHIFRISQSITEYFFSFFFSFVWNIRAAEPNNHIECQYANQDVWLRGNTFADESIVVVDKFVKFQHTDRNHYRTTATWRQCHRHRIRASCWQSIQFRLEKKLHISNFNEPWIFFSTRYNIFRLFIIFFKNCSSF